MFDYQLSCLLVQILAIRIRDSHSWAVTLEDKDFVVIEFISANVQPAIRNKVLGEKKLIYKYTDSFYFEKEIGEYT